MADETMLMLAGEVRGKTLRILETVSDDEARFTGPGLNNSILWHAGHAVVVVEHLSIIPASGLEPAYPQGWHEKFAWKSEPAKVTQWPALADVKEVLRSQLARLQETIRGLASHELDRMLDAGRNRTLRYSILHGLHDEAGHQGEMYLLRKLYTCQSTLRTATGP